MKRSQHDLSGRYNLALKLIAQGRREDARRELLALYAATPNFAPLSFTLGRLAMDDGDDATAESLLRAAASAPALATDARLALAEVYARLNRLDAAVSTLEWIVEHRPDCVQAFVTLAEKLLNPAPQRALAVAQSALARFPGHAPLMRIQGRALLELKRADEAIAPLRRAAESMPSASTLGVLLRALRETARWEEEAALMATLRAARDRTGAPSRWPISLYSALCFSFTSKELVEIARQNARRYLQALAPLPPAEPKREGPLVVGYLSPDFREHAVANVFADTFAAHDPARVRAVAFSVGPDDGSAERSHFIETAHPFVDLRGLSDRAAAERIRAEGTHILVDIGLYTRHARPGIAAHRPAPIQAAWLGLAATTGAPWFDYLLTDDIAAPSADSFTETPVYLPHGYHPARRPRPLPPPPSRTAENLPEDAVVFGCFNNHPKIDRDSFSAWIDILEQVPGSVLWLRDAPEATRANYRAFAAARGITAARLVFADRTADIDAHIARLGCADLMLDCLVYGAHTTCLDALHAGVPMLTVLGETLAARVGASLLTRAGMPELVLPNRDAFVAEAIRLGNDAAARAALREKLARAVPASKVFDPNAQARALEDAFEAMWTKRTA